MVSCLGLSIAKTGIVYQRQGGGYSAGHISHNCVSDVYFAGVQSQLDREVRPFAAFDDLAVAQGHRTDPRRRWMSATTAAELAIKEFLARYNPDLAPLLFKMPSPPLTKLYGEILEEYAGSRSPAFAWIGPGIEIRNKMTHSPESVQMPAADSWKYARAIEVALYDLMARLYPADDMIQERARCWGKVDEVPTWVKRFPKSSPPLPPRSCVLRADVVTPGEVRLLIPKSNPITFAPEPNSRVGIVVEEKSAAAGKNTKQRFFVKVFTVRDKKVIGTKTGKSENGHERLEIVVGGKKLLFEPGKPPPYREFYLMFAQDILRKPAEPPSEAVAFLHRAMSPVRAFKR